MALKIFAGDFRSGSTGPNGFRLKLCGGTENQAELIPLSNVQTLERFDNTSEIMRSEKWGIGTATPSLSVLMKLPTARTRAYRLSLASKTAAG
jgi:hypothetical protein